MKPNVILIMCDELRYDCLGCAGHPHVRTPNLDRLAENGIFFDHAYCASPMCSPARASWLTGLYPHAHGQLINYRIRPDLIGRKGAAMHPDCTTLGDAFKAAGYRCGIVGPWHLGRDTQPQHGFEEYWMTHGYQGEGNPDRLWDYFTDEGVENLYLKPRQSKTQVGTHRTANLRYVTAKDPRQQRTTWSVDRSIDFFEGDRETSQPGFLFLSIKDPHPLMVVPPDLVATYPPEEIDLPDTWGDPLDGKPEYQKHEKGRLSSDFDPDRFRITMAHYFALVTHIDSQLGRLFEYLKERGLLDNTIIAFISDHGEMLGDHGFITKRVLYEGSVRVPCILSWPAELRNPSRLRTPLAGVDLMPTLLELADVPRDDAINGRSIATDLLLGREPQPSPVFAEVPTWSALECTSDDERVLAAQLMVRDGAWKYIRNRFDADELYDLDNDSNEMQNRAADVDQENRIRMMRHQIREMLHKTGPGLYAWCLEDYDDSTRGKPG
jgi:arylsulfatase A-like enzyme